MDLLQRRAEAESLATACALLGHEAATLHIRSEPEFVSTCEYLSTIDSSHDPRERKLTPLCIHVSAHGNDDGIAVGSGLLAWKELAAALRPLASPLAAYDGKVILVLSACAVSGQKLTGAIQAARRKDSAITPPAYVFATSDKSLLWSDAIASWTIFYHQLPKTNLADRTAVQGVLHKILDIGAATIVYYRWDETSDVYREYRPEAPKKSK